MNESCPPLRPAALVSRWLAPLLGLAGLIIMIAAAPPVIAPAAGSGRPGAELLDAPIWIDPDLTDNAAVALAIEDLAAAIDRPGRQPTAVLSPELVPDRGILIVAPDSPLGRRLGVAGDLPTADDSYRIERRAAGDRALTLITGRGRRGPAYGVFRLADALRTEDPALFHLTAIVVSPAFTFRLTGDPLDPADPEPAEALRRGYNAVLLGAWPELAGYAAVDPRLYDPVAAPLERDWLLRRRAHARARIAAAKRLDLDVVAIGDLVTLPRRLAELEGTAVGPAAGRSVFCLDRPIVRRLVAAGLDEVLTDFPGIDAVMVRTGENYAGGHLAGNPPHRAPGCPVENADATLRDAIDLVRRVTVDQHGRTYIQRAWDLGAQTFHGDPRVAGSITEGLPFDPRLRFSFKHTQTDFWRYNEPNPNLANRRLTRMIELQAQREYEGKGAFPNFLGGAVAEGFPETRAPGSLASVVRQGVQSVWVWPKGGGWGGPALTDDLWVDANRYAFERLIWEPDRRPADLARAWATGRFGRDLAPTIAAWLERSPAIVLGAFYPRAAGWLSDGWLPNQNWVRDDRIAGADAVRPLYLAARQIGLFDATLEESAAARAEALAWQRRLSRVIDAPPRGSPEAAALASARYQSSLLVVLDDYLAGLFYYFRWQDSAGRSEADREFAAERLRAARANLRVHQAIARADGFATPYQDAGFEAAIADSLREIGG